MSDLVKQHLRTFADDLKSGRALAPGEFRRILDAQTRDGTDAQKAALLALLSAHDQPTAMVPILTQAALYLREHPEMVRVSAPEGAIDIVGTGGDGQSTFNISTASAFVVAGAGVPVAKHGNRAVSSRSGASDVLAALGVKLDVPRDIIECAIREAGVGFLWAPQHHPAMKSWAKVRGELGFRTIFNLLGPLCNPAHVKRQVIGVYAQRWVRPVAEVMQRLGSEHVWVVHGSDGLDELTTTGPSYVAELKGGEIREFEVTPEAYGLSRANPLDLVGDDPAHNASALRSILDRHGPTSKRHHAYRDIVLLNAAAALLAGGSADSLEQGLDQADKSIGTGEASAALDKLIAITNGLA